MSGEITFKDAEGAHGLRGDESNGPDDCTEVTFDEFGQPKNFPQSGWQEYELEFLIPEPHSWAPTPAVVASVFFTKIYNVAHAIYAGWDIRLGGIRKEGNIFELANGQIRLFCRVRVSDNDGFLCRAGYHAVAIGRPFG
jgi:hypothetical protein